MFHKNKSKTIKIEKEVRKMLAWYKMILVYYTFLGLVDYTNLKINL